MDFLLVFVVVDRFFEVTFSDNLGVRVADESGEDSTMADREGEEIAVAI